MSLPTHLFYRWQSSRRLATCVYDPPNKSRHIPWRDLFYGLWVYGHWVVVMGKGDAVAVGSACTRVTRDNASKNESHSNLRSILRNGFISYPCGWTPVPLIRHSVASGTDLMEWNLRISLLWWWEKGHSMPIMADRASQAKDTLNKSDRLWHNTMVQGRQRNWGGLQSGAADIWGVGIRQQEA